MNDGERIPPCAACKHQRRKCHPNCLLARYFPPGHTEQFDNVRRLFGVSNILKVLAVVDENHMDHTVETMKIEADERRNNPVYGCYGVISDLANQICDVQRELNEVNQQLLFCKQRDFQLKQLQQHGSKQKQQQQQGPSSSSVPQQQFGPFYYPPLPLMNQVQLLPQKFGQYYYQPPMPPMNPQLQKEWRPSSSSAAPPQLLQFHFPPLPQTNAVKASSSLMLQPQFCRSHYPPTPVMIPVGGMYNGETVSNLGSGYCSPLSIEQHQDKKTFQQMPIHKGEAGETSTSNRNIRYNYPPKFGEEYQDIKPDLHCQAPCTSENTYGSSTGSTATDTQADRLNNVISMKGKQLLKLA